MSGKERSRVAENVKKLMWSELLLASFIFPISTIMSYWEAHGVGIGDALLLQVAFAVAIIVLEVPSGYIADVLGRRPALILGAVCAFIGSIIYVAARDFAAFLAAELVLGLGFSFLSPRPLPYGDSSEAVSLLDATLGLLWGPLDLSLDAFNLFDVRYGAVEYSYASDWSPNDGVRSRLPARHLAAGAPLSLMVNLGIRL